MKSIHRMFAFLALLSSNLVRCGADESSDPEDNETPAGKPEAKSGYDSQGFGYEQQSPQVFYGGQYGGRCEQDGFYYNDENSFVMCNHGIAYAQQCAPGTRNGMASQYKAGGYYTHTAFCDINLVDFGYAAFHSQRGRGKGGYGSSGSKATSGGYSARSSYGHTASQPSYHSSNSGGYSARSSYGHSASQPSYHSSSSDGSSARGKNDGSSYGIYGYHGDSGSQGYGQSSYNSQAYGSTQASNTGYGSSRYSGYGFYQPSTSYRQPTYQVVSYRPSYTSYQQQRPQHQTSYGQKPQGHSTYGRKYSGYYTQRRYVSQPAMKY